MAVEITGIRLSGSARTHESITDFRWKNVTNGTSDVSSKATMVDWIDNQNGTAYVGSGSDRANVGTVHPEGGKPYLRTYADGEWNNNLLSLPEI